MATSSHSSMSKLDPFTQVVLHSALKVAQAGSMVVPPTWVIWSLARRNPLSVRRLMRVSTASVVVGAAAGGGLAYMRLQIEPRDKIEDRVYRLARNKTQVRTDDYSIIGSVLGAIITPTIFLNRAPIASLVIGGASLGLGAGVWTHIIQSFTTGEEVAPAAMVSWLSADLALADTFQVPEVVDAVNAVAPPAGDSTGTKKV
ncbi:hypothetical protein VHUM_03125 [Vanrija humicola]|uniref:Uncharacterized protein n=1 Tax=Vanrija humicola TaxID=5417 RepID=A0A7D8Z1X8_VANHU|nr:hypothetical protein VHUM_03125 [Vanrija humicola]